MPPPSITPASQSGSGLAHLIPTPQPDINNRQASEPNDLITLSITRDTTTFTTVIILGGTAAPSTIDYQPASATITLSGSSPSTAAPSTVDYQSASATTTLSGSSPSTAAPVAKGPTGTPSRVIVGAVLGSIFGTILCLALIWLCCYSPYRPNFPWTDPFYDDGGTELASWESESRKSSRRRKSRLTTEEVVMVSRPVSNRVYHGESRSEERIERIRRDRKGLPPGLSRTEM